MESKSSDELRTAACAGGGALRELYKAEGFGQLTMRTIPPGVVAGGHRHPNTNEWWWIPQGDASIRLELPDGTRELHNISGGASRIIEVPAGTGHEIANIGEDDIVLVWRADRMYDPDASDKEDWQWT